MREIVTIQVGDFANYIGSHFWNFQDELIGLAEDQHGDSIYKNSSLNMDVLYRTGETQQGILTYNPRLISIGLQGSLGSLSSTGSIYNGDMSVDSSDIISWKDKRNTIERRQKMKKGKIALQILEEPRDSEAQVWCTES